MVYDYTDSMLSCAEMVEDAFRRREDCVVYRVGEINPEDADLAFNTLPNGGFYEAPITIWWDIEACNYFVTENFNHSNIVLAPYTVGQDIYPKGKTFFFPFATDPTKWYHHPEQPIKYDVGFVGREDLNRHKRVEYLDYLEGRVTLLRTNGIPRGKETSKLLSQAKIILQVTGDALGGVMETRFFEVGLVGLLASDYHKFNKEDMDWAAVADYHYVAFETKEEMVEKIGRVLKDKRLRLKMRKRAFKNYRKNHTYDARVRKLLEHIGFLKGKGLENLHSKRSVWES